MIKSILGGKSKNLCDVAYLLTLPLDKNFERYGFWEVEISVEPNTAYTLSRENSDLINLGGSTYFGLANEYSDPTPDNVHHKWLNHQLVASRCRKSVTLTSNSDGKLWVFFSSSVYKLWQKNLNPFGYIQLEKGSTATEYVPHELTSYKSIMKVSDVCQLGDKRKYNQTETKSGVTFTNNGDGTITVNGTSTQLVDFNLQFIDFIKNHTYLLIGCPSGGSTSTYILDTGADMGNDKGNGTISKPRLIGNRYFSIYVYPNTTCNNLVFKPQLFDLTEMFGAGNEPKTVAEFKAKFPNDYYPYSPSCFVTSFDERMPCKTKNLINSQQIYQISQHMNVTIWQGEVNYVCTFSYELAMLETNDGAAALFEFTYSDGTYSYITHRDKYRVLSQITDNKKLTKVRLFNWSDVKGILSNIQLEKGTTATDYVPYGYV